MAVTDTRREPAGGADEAPASGSARRPTASILVVRVLLEALDRAGVPHDALLGSEPRVRAQLDDVNARVDQVTLERLQERALDLTRDPGLGLEIGQHMSESAFDLLAHLVAHAGTMREALGLAAQFARLILDGGAVQLGEDRTTATVRLEFAPGSSARASRLMAELSASALLRMIRVFAGAAATVTGVRFLHARPDHHADYAKVFGGVERFGQPFLGLTFDRALLDRPHLHQHPALLAMLRSEAERTLQRLTRDLRTEDRVRDYLLAKAPAQMPDMDAAARELGVSPRSLRRRLAHEGVTYRGIVQAALEMLAIRMLEDPTRTIQETAHAMGFSDATAFHRAFKRWTGRTPQQYRAEPR